ncbi:MAG: hypothetical protein NC131_06220 [Roseburia sp.]|nr:hypothetical protein [Roseburia sp.]
MANIIPLRWTKVAHSGNDKGYFYESNLVKVKGHAAVQVEVPNEAGLDISYLVSLSGDKFVSVYQDYFANLHIQELKFFGVGQIVKFRINKLPTYAIIQGDDLTDAGDINPEELEDIVNAFAGSDGELFRGNNTEIFAGKQP